MNDSKKLKKVNVRRMIFIYGGLAWAVLHFIVFWLYINLSTVYNSFFNINVYGDMEFVGIRAYREAFLILTGQKMNGMASLNSVLNTFSLILLSLFINLPITLAFSYMIFVKIKGVSVLRVGLYIPCVLSVVILCLFFKIIMSGTATYQGGIFTLLESMGYNNEFIIKNGVLATPETAWPVVLLVFSTWTGVTGNIIYFNSAMARLPESVLESAELDGATQCRQFFNMVIPMIWPVITTMSITLIGGAIQWFQPVQLMIGDGLAAETRTGTLAWIIVSQVKNGSTVGFPAAFGVLVSIIFAILIVLFRWGMDKIYSEVEY